MNYIEFDRYGDSWKVPDAFYRVSIKLILKNDKNELLVLQSIADELYEVPGGGLDWGETVEAAARRELHEELALTLEDMGKQPFASEYAVHPDGFYTIKIYFHATTSGSPKNNEPDRFTHSWVSKDQFLSLEMPSDESPIQKHVEVIWPSDA